ncbi:hypothetical protein Syun_027791 [Stephania yunnanensis]|uniref:Uncharacterized protein n=1 Tax=Stephania yunnanensis TaxID=152371 RepID=A0AAP0HRK4_9MAGN
MGDHKITEDVIPSPKKPTKKNKYWSDERSSDIHPTRPQNQRRTSGGPDGNHQPLLPIQLGRRRPNIKLDRPPLHNNTSRSHLLHSH